MKETALNNESFCRIIKMLKLNKVSYRHNQMHYYTKQLSSEHCYIVQFW